MITCDLFCTVIDNYGDLGVCWRLARQLDAEHGVQVTLWVDDLRSFHHLAPALDPAQDDQWLGRLRVRHWRPGVADALAGHLPADLVIEGFACRLPDAYLRAMRSRTPTPVWINLEYLSAEAWVEDCHRGCSTHPRTGLIQHFWFPGFSPRTGGLLREAGLCDALDHPESSLALLERLGIPAPASAGRLLSLFSYENAALPGLLDTLAGDATPTRLLVFAGRALAGVSDWLSQPLGIGDEVTQGALTVQILPLLDHADYDRLLACCDLNLVRGEDSFVRAQWAGRPLLWHIYAQDEQAHLPKLHAFIDRFNTVAGPDETWAQAMRAWNQDAAAGWPALLAALSSLRSAALAWRSHLLAQDDLATQLMRFYTDQVESAPVPQHPRNR